jgi:hypothetical protein
LPVSINFEDQVKRTCFDGSADDLQNALFVFDPAESLRLLPQLNHNYRMIICTHELNIPIGVGFNMPMLPSLVRNKNWRLPPGQVSTLDRFLDDERPRSSSRNILSGLRMSIIEVCSL